MIEVTKEAVNEALIEFRKNIDENRYTISKGENREQNELFISEYMLSNKRIKIMLKEIKAEDCIGVELHYKDKSKVVYKFIKKYNINTRMSNEEVLVYIKFILCPVRCQQHSLVISFHPTDKMEEYLFK